MNWKQKPIFARLIPGNVITQSPARVVITLVTTHLSLVIWETTVNDRRGIEGSWSEQSEGLAQQTIFCRASLPKSAPWRLHPLDSTDRFLCLLAFSGVWSMVGEEKRRHKQHDRGAMEESWVGCLLTGFCHSGLLWPGCFPWLKFVLLLGTSGY